MTHSNRCEREVIMDLEMLNRTNSQGCKACGKKFTLGESVVLAAGDWGDDLRYIHEKESICDIGSGKHVVRDHFASPVQEPPNEPKKSPVQEPGKTPPEPPQPQYPPVEEPPGEPKKPPVKEPPPKDPDREPPTKPPMKVGFSGDPHNP